MPFIARLHAPFVTSSGSIIPLVPSLSVAKKLCISQVNPPTRYMHRYLAVKLVKISRLIKDNKRKLLVISVWSELRVWRELSVWHELRVWRELSMWCELKACGDL